MAKSYCLNFSNCSPLARRFGVNQQGLNTFINLYNRYASREDWISPEKEYSDEELEEIYNKVSKQREEHKANKKYRAAERSMLVESYGGPEALALKEVSETFNPEEMQNLMEELGGSVLDLLIKLSKQRNCTVEDFLKKGGNDVVNLLFNVIAKRYREKLLEATSVRDGHAPIASSNIQTVEQANQVINTIVKLFSPGKYAGNVFDSLKILSLSVINQALGLRIHGDFTLDADSNVSYEIADSVQETESPMQERYMQALDAQGLEDSLSGIVSRVLMQLPQKRTIVHTEVTTLPDGTEVVNATTSEETVKSLVFGQPLYSNPKVVARRLANILSGITGEEEMMDILRGSGYEELVNTLDADARLKTTFFQEFNRYAQTYRQVSLSVNSDGTVNASAETLGRSKNEGLNSYQNRLNMGNISDNSVYQRDPETGTVSFKKFSYFSGVQTWFNKIFYAQKESGAKVHTGSPFDVASPKIKESYLASIMEFLNIPVTEKGIGILLSDSSKLMGFLDSVNSFLVSGENILGKNFAGVNANIKGKFFNNKDISTSIANIMSILEATPKSFYGSRVTFEGSSLSTMIMNSPLSILAKKINSLYDRVEDGKQVYDLSNFLVARFLHSPQYMTSSGRILNRWLRDIQACADEFIQPCAKSIFGFSRDLGINHVPVEHISDQQHMLLLLHGYLGGRTFATTRDQLVTAETEEEEKRIQELSATDSKRYIIMGSPVYYQRGKRYYRKDVAYIPSFITGDTNAIRQIRTIHYYEDEVLDGMYDLFMSDKVNQGIIEYFNDKGIVFSANGKEAYTSNQVKEGKTKTRKSNASKFGILQFLNQRIGNYQATSLGLAPKGKSNPTWYEYFLQKAAEKQGIEKPLNTLTQEERVALEADKETFKEVASIYMSSGFEDFKAQLQQLGLLDKTPDGKYVNFDSYLGKTEDKEAALDELLKDFYYDYKFGQYNQAQLMQVNPLFLNGVEDHQKRNKGVLTNGSPLSMEACEDDGTPIWGYNPETGTYDFTSKVVYFKDVKVGLDKASRDALYNYYKGVYSKTSKTAEEAEARAKEHISKFNSNSLTDGQAYRTLESYRKVLMSAGKQFWTDSHESAYNLIMSLIIPIRAARKEGRIESLSVEDVQKIENALAVMQPIKPINDGVEVVSTDLGNINIPFQFKYAEVPIVPELLPVGCKLRELGDMMTDLGIDMIASDKCLKKGSYGEMDLQYKMVGGKYVDASGNILPGMDADGKIIDDGSQTAAQQRANPQNSKKFVEYEEGTSVKDIFAAHYVDDTDPGFVVHSVSMENYLLQSNVPDHTDGNSIVGTQGRKIGTGAIVNSDSYTYSIGPKGAKVSGKQLARLYNAAHTLKYAKSYNKFVERIDDTSSIVSDLIYNMLNNGRGNLATASRLTLIDGKTPTISFSEPSTAKDVQRNLISIFKKTVIRQLISGGSIVQASSLGYGKTALSDTGLKAVIKDGVPIAMQTEMPFDFHYTDEDGNMIQLRFEDYCDENGYFLDMDGNPIMEDRYDQIEEISKICHEFPGICDIVAYRIPTEMEYSMFHLKIVKCNPKTSTNTIKLPAEGTTMAGFDFDIDKLFLMRHNYKAKDKVDEYTVWTHFYETNPGIANALRQAWVEDGSKKDVPLHSYWDDVMAQYPSYAAEYSNKDDAYKTAKAQLQSNQINREPFNYDMSPEDLVNLSQSELDNLIIDCMVAILSDESTVGDRYSIGGFEDASFNAKLMRLLMAGMWDEGYFSDFVDKVDSLEDVKPEYDYSEPMTSVIFKEQNQIAGTLIGIFANDNVNAFISRGLKTFKIADKKNRILFGSLLEGVTELDGNIEDIDSSDIGLSFKHDSVNGKSIKKTLAELLAASVDAVKDPVLNYLNLNVITADSAAMLARLGYTTRDIGLLFNQPVIKQMCIYMNRSGETNIRRALTKVLADMGSRNPKGLFDYKATFDSSGLTQEVLARNISQDESADLRTQEIVAQLFNSISQTKSDFSTYIQQTRNTSANTIRSRFEDYQSSSDKGNKQFSRIVIETSDEIDYPITDDITEASVTSKAGMRELISKYKDHPFLYENVVSGIIDSAMKHMMDKYTLYTTPKYTKYRNILRQLIAPWGLSGDQIESLYQDIPIMQLVSMPGDFNPEHMSDGEIPNAIKYVDTDNFIAQLEKVLTEHPELNELPIIKALDIELTGKNKDAPRLTLKYSRGITSVEKLGITYSWDQLMSLGGEAAEVAKGLYLHFYYTRGLNPETNVAMELAPVSVLKSLIVDEESGLSYANFFNKTLDIYSEDLDSPDSALKIKKDLYQFLLSHSNDSKLVKTIDIKLDDCRGPRSEEIVFRSSKGFQFSDVKNSLDLVTLQVDKQGNIVKGAYYAPVIKVEGKVYVLAKLDSGDYVIDYQNYKEAGTGSVRYVPATLLDSSSDVLREKLQSYYGEQNSLIFKDIPNSISLNSVISEEDEITSDTSESGDSAEEAYDSAKEATKDDEVESSDGRPKCHRH